MIEILRNLFLVFHFVGFAVIIGGILGQIPAMKVGAATVKAAVMHGAWTMLASGLLLVGMKYAAGAGDEVDNAKIGVKLVVLIAIVVIALMNRKKERVATWVLPTIGGLTLLNIVLAVFW